jgi:predicted nuclease of predicted toxin-antitoxin system
MRLLLDESVTHDLIPSLEDEHEVLTVRGLNWNGRPDGSILALARGQFDAMITTDQKIPYQQHITDADVPIVILAARSNSIVDLEPLVPRTLAILPTLRPGDVIRIESNPM